MKKLLFISAFALVMLASCQNETTEAENKTTSVVQKDILKLERQALDLVKSQMKKQAAKSDVETGPTEVSDAVIVCHTDWLKESGTSCVSNGGFLFKVMWDLEDPWDPNNHNKVWLTVRVSTCSC